MYVSQMQNFSAGRFLYGTGEERTIRLLLKSKDMYVSQMQNFSAGRFLYGTGEERTIRLLLKSKDSIADIPKLTAKNFWGSFYLGS